MMKGILSMLVFVVLALGSFAQNNPVFTGTVTFNNSQFAGSAIFPPNMLGIGTPSSLTYLRGDGRWATVTGGSSSSIFTPSVSASNGVQVIAMGTGFNAVALDEYIGTTGASTNIVIGINGTSVARFSNAGLNSVNIGSLTPGTGAFTALSASSGTLNGVTVTGLPSPSASSDAATKFYVDSVAAGIVPRTAVVVATTANITLSGPQTIDGIAVVASNRVLVKNQTSTFQNGIYDCAAGAWSRSSDSNTALLLKLGYYYFVQSGTTQGNTSWTIQTAPTVLNTDPVIFSQFSASQTYVAGSGLTLGGNSFSVNAAQPGITSVGTLSSLVLGGALTSSSTATFTNLLIPTITGNNTGVGNLTVTTGTNGTLTLTGAGTSGGVVVNVGSSNSLTENAALTVKTSTATGGTNLNLVNASVGGATWGLISGGSASSQGPGTFTVYDYTNSRNALKIDTATRTSLYALENTPIGAATPSTGVFTAVTTPALTLTGPFSQLNAVSTYNFMGQDSTHNLVFGWTYSATPTSGFALLSTFGSANRIYYQASDYVWDTVSQATAFYLDTLGNARFSHYGAGTATFDSSGNITSTSDERAKDTIRNFTTGLDSVRKLQPKVYHWKKETGLNTDDVNVSVYAQDLIAAGIPEAVFTQRTVGVMDDQKTSDGRSVKKQRLDANGNPVTQKVDTTYTVSDRTVISALVNSVKELADQNDALEARISALEKGKHP